MLRKNKIVEHAVQPKTLATRAKLYDDIHNTFTILCDKSEKVSFSSLIIQNIILLFTPFRFPVT